jgi:hypothetical protein
MKVSRTKGLSRNVKGSANKVVIRGCPGVTIVAQDPTVIIGTREIISAMSKVFLDPKGNTLKGAMACKNVELVMSE